MSLTLHALFERSASAHPDRMAVADPGRGEGIGYAALDRLVDSLAAELTRHGVADGQRVGLYAPKSIPTVAAILATLRTGAAYVPVDTTAPVRRGVEILTDCNVRAIVLERSLATTLRGAWGRPLPLRDLPGSDDHAVKLALLDCEEAAASPIGELAYILCTSGSTGKPKGVMHTHASARSFVDWCVTTFEPRPDDRFSSHAPFHFDLSILDLYVPLTCGASVVLVGEEEGKNPQLLAPLIAESGISVWYSTPSVLRLLVERGGRELHDAARLRLVLFAGEVFAPGHLRTLQQAWSGRRYWNLYGPTETNVCTAYEVVGDVPADRTDPYPIGKPITGDETLVLDVEGRPVPHGGEGELVVHGGTVMAGYWGQPNLDAKAFYVDGAGRRWYRTGDVVRENKDGDYVFHGRRDRMIKRRGYRVELGEIEAALYRHPGVAEAAIVAVPDADGIRVDAFVHWTGSEPTSTIAMKRFCVENLPLYMVPDRFRFLDELPKTSTDKVDYVRLRAMDG
jgi:amino acid adenylation domain-containing protein